MYEVSRSKLKPDGRDVEAEIVFFDSIFSSFRSRKAKFFYVVVTLYH